MANSFEDSDIPGPFCRNPSDAMLGTFSAKPWCYVRAESGVVFASCTVLEVKGKMLYRMIGKNKYVK